MRRLLERFVGWLLGRVRRGTAPRNPEREERHGSVRVPFVGPFTPFVESPYTRSDSDASPHFTIYAENEHEAIEELTR